jgi:hypothetical protein
MLAPATEKSIPCFAAAMNVIIIFFVFPIGRSIFRNRTTIGKSRIQPDAAFG